MKIRYTLKLESKLMGVDNSSEATIEVEIEEFHSQEDYENQRDMVHNELFTIVKKGLKILEEESWLSYLLKNSLIIFLI